MKSKLQIITKIFMLTLLVVGLLVSSLTSIAQPVLKIGNYYSCSNTEMLIPVKLEKFEDISAFTIFISIDTANIEYMGLENVNELFSTGNFVDGVNLTNQYITFNWVSLTPVNIESGVMCNIRILLKNNYVDLNFKDNCEIVRSDLSIIENVDYIDGYIATMSSIEPSPTYQSVSEDASANIEIIGPSSDIVCQWQIYNNDQWVDIVEESPYSGVNTFNLFIDSVSADMNTKMYRGVLSNNICSEATMESELIVIVSSLDEQNINVVMQVYPNPADGYLNCVFNEDIQRAKLRLVSMSGMVLFEQEIENITSGKKISINIEDIEAGKYILNLFNNSGLISTLKLTII